MGFCIRLCYYRSFVLNFEHEVTSSQCGETWSWHKLQFVCVCSLNLQKNNNVHRIFFLLGFVFGIFAHNLSPFSFNTGWLQSNSRSKNLTFLYKNYSFVKLWHSSVSMQNPTPRFSYQALKINSACNIESMHRKNVFCI